jgi:hypothetical protein
MQALIWSGAAVSLLGLAGLVWCIAIVNGARRKGLPEDEMTAVLRRIIPRNLAALFLSVIGLMMVVVGIFLG